MTSASDARRPPRLRLAIGFDRGSVSAGEIIRSLPQDCDIAFLLADTPYAYAARPLLECAGEVLPADDATIAKLARRDDGNGSDAIVTFSETMLRYCSTVANRTGAVFHDAATVTVLTDKFVQRDQLRRTGIDPTRSVQCFAAELVTTAVRFGFPCVVKPTRGQGSRETFLLTGPADLDQLDTDTLQAGEWVVEEFLAGAPPLASNSESGGQNQFGDYVSVESMCTPGGIRHLAVTGKYPFLAPFREVGQFWPAPLEPEQDERIRELVSAALGALDLSCGLTHTEVKLTDAGPRIIEINGRLGGHLHELYGRAAGLDLARIAIDLALGRGPDTEPAWRSGVSFQYNSPAPTGAAQYQETNNVRAVRRMPGVEAYRVYAAAGEWLPGGLGTHQLDLLSGWAPDHRSMFAILDEAVAGIHHRFLDASGREVELEPGRPWHTGDPAAAIQAEWRQVGSG